MPRKSTKNPELQLIKLMPNKTMLASARLIFDPENERVFKNLSIFKAIYQSISQHEWIKLL